MDRPEIHWQEIAALLYRRRKLILTAVTVGVALALLSSWTATPMYRASAKLMVTPERARMNISPDEKAGATISEITELDLNSEVALLTSTSLVREALQPAGERAAAEQDRGTLGMLAALARLPLQLPDTVYRAVHGVPATGRFEKQVQETVANLSVEPVKKSNLIEMRFRSEHREWSAEFLNRLAFLHVERRALQNQRPDARRFFEGQSVVLNEKLHQAERALRDFYEREGIESTPARSAELRTHLIEIENGLLGSETELAEASARAEFLTREIRSYPGKIAGGGRLSQSEGMQLIQNRIITLELERSQLLSRYAPTSIRIGEIDRQITEARSLLRQQKQSGAASLIGVDPTYQSLEVDLGQAQAQIAALEARVGSLRQQRERIRSTLAHLEAITSEQERLAQQVDTSKGALLTYLKKEEQARFADALDESRILNVSVVELADVPADPEPSNSGAIVLLAVMASLVLGVTAAAAIDRLDPTVKTTGEAQRITKLPLLSEVSS